MKTNSTRGFTLIELLVVIAIIGILSGIVLASLSTARQKAFDTKVKTQLNQIRNAAETYYASNFNYGPTTSSCTAAGSMFQDTTTGMSRLSISANYPTGENTIICNATSSPPAYAVSDTFLATSSFWCVDSTGASRAEVASLGSSTVCQ
jgi:prepilin-type N-terminal cleavage/methylation domain-containing protein